MNLNCLIFTQNNLKPKNKMAKIAKLVTISITTRVIVEEGTTDEAIMEVAIPRCIDIIKGDGVFDHLVDISDDTEVPFGIINEDSK